jgi:hypothetical protein
MSELANDLTTFHGRGSAKLSNLCQKCLDNILHFGFPREIVFGVLVHLEIIVGGLAYFFVKLNQGLCFNRAFVGGDLQQKRVVFGKASVFVPNHKRQSSGCVLARFERRSFAFGYVDAVHSAATNPQVALFEHGIERVARQKPVKKDSFVQVVLLYQRFEVRDLVAASYHVEDDFERAFVGFQAFDKAVQSVPPLYVGQAQKVQRLTVEGGFVQQPKLLNINAVVGTNGRNMEDSRLTRKRNDARYPTAKEGRTTLVYPQFEAFDEGHCTKLKSVRKRGDFHKNLDGRVVFFEAIEHPQKEWIGQKMPHIHKIVLLDVNLIQVSTVQKPQKRPFAGLLMADLGVVAFDFDGLVFKKQHIHPKPMLSKRPRLGKYLFFDAAVGRDPKIHFCKD